MPLDKKTKELLRQGDRQNRSHQRELDRDRQGLVREEKRLEGEIKKAAKQGDKQTCAILAKQLVQVRKQKSRTHSFGATLSSINSQQKVAASTMKIGDAMGTSTKVMQKMNKQMDASGVAKQLRDFDMAKEKMGMTEEMLDDSLSSAFDDDDAESDAVVKAVLDELSIDANRQLNDVPSLPTSSRNAAANSNLQEDDLERMLNNLRDG